MLASSKASTKAMGRSNMSASKASSASSKKDNFITFAFKRIYAWLAYTWTKTRSFLWVGSTGTHEVT